MKDPNFGLRALESLGIALRAMRASPARTLLSTLGIVIGVGALVAIFALTDGLEQFSRTQIESTTDLQIVLVTPRVSERVDGLTMRIDNPVELTGEDAISLGDEVGSEALVSLVARTSDWIAVPGDTGRIAVLTTHLQLTEDSPSPVELSSGRFLAPSDSEDGQMVAVVSANLALRVADSPASAIGEMLSPSWGDFEIIGVLADEEGAAMQQMFVPYGVVPGRLEETNNPASLAVRVNQIEDAGRIRDAIDTWVSMRFAERSDNLSVVSNESRVEQATRAMLVFKLIMGAIAGISLVVGGVGIMNVLLASVSERTREIGLRKAAGARAGDIRIQFLAESLAISGLGCVIGLVLGMGAATILARVVRQITDAPVEAAFTWPSLLIAAGASLLTGLIFGTWPARRAARLSPIDALRDE